MSTRIDSIYCFDYTKEIGFYDSVRDFTHLEMEYIAMAVSTEKVHVNSIPTRFKIDTEGTDNIREYVISRMGQLIEICKDLAINSPQYILITPVNEPRSGDILSGSEVYDGSEITISASGGDSCVVKLKTSSGVTRLSFYVRAGDTVTVSVPAEYLYVYFASGDTWYGTSNLFGEYTSYSMDDEILDFTEYTREYTLYSVNSSESKEWLFPRKENKRK